MVVPQPEHKSLPTGTVTFLFTDIEGSTRLLSQLGEVFTSVIDAHADILRAAIAAHHGIEVNTEGDAFFAVFPTAADAIAAAADGQRGLAAHEWPSGVSVRVRMGAHSGEGRLGGDDYIGIDVNRAARIAAAAHGGQIIISEATRALLPQGRAPELVDLGAHELKDLEASERLFQVVLPGLQSEFPPPRAKRRGNLPEPTTSFIGRAEAIAEVEALLRGSRLVTITGPGGMGKTRLALQAASDFAAAMRDGAWFVPLDTLREPDLLPAAIATALELTSGEAEPMALLKSHLAERELLLVLDNFEQIATAGEFVDELMRAATGIRALVTSQSPLGLYGEHEYPAPPLRTPDPAAPPPLDRILESEAVALFVARARAAKPRFRIDEHNAAAVVELVVRLDGLPLAIELAAARIKLLTPKAILDRLERRLDLLTTSARNIPERQRTLRGAIDWSYGLLEPEEQHVFDRIGVFAGGFDLAAAEAIVSPGGECRIDLLDALSSLVEKSLVRQDEQDDEPRFSQLESIRQYALDRLGQRDEVDLLHRRLAERMAQLVAEAEPNLDRRDDLGWFARLDAELDNIRAALRWTVGAAETELAERIIGPAWRYWLRKGLLAEGSWWTDEVLALPSGRTATRAKTLIAGGSLAYWRTDYDASEEPYATALDIYRELGDEAGVTEASYNVAYAYWFRTGPDPAAAHAAFQTALEGFRTAGNDAMAQSTLFSVGMLFGYEERWDESEQVFREALEMDAGDLRPRVGLASVASQRGDHDGARRWLDELVRDTRDVQDVSFTIVVLETYVGIEYAAGNIELAMQLDGAAAALRRRIGGGPPRTRVIGSDPEPEARAVIGDEAVEAALQRGGELSADEALELALSHEGLPPAV